MSHTSGGELKNFSGSTQLLKQILLSKFPEWVDCMIEDPTEHFINYSGREEKNGYEIIISGGNRARTKGGKKAKGIGGCDVGFRKNPDGSWAVDVDQWELNQSPNEDIKTLQKGNVLSVGLAELKVKEIMAKLNGKAQIQDTGSEVKITCTGIPKSLIEQLSKEYGQKATAKA